MTFVPDPDAPGRASNTPVATATTDAEGRFELKAAGQNGAAPGKYKVTVTKVESSGGPAAVPSASTDPSEAAKQLSQTGQQRMQSTSPQPGPGARMGPQPASGSTSVVPAKYSSLTGTPLTFDVTPQGPNDFEIELTD